MATLAKDTPRNFELTGGHPSYNEIPIIADDIVYAGAAVGESSTTGTGRPLVAADSFMGFCVEKCDNTGGSASDKRIKVVDKGGVRLIVSGVTDATSYDATIYASDDATFTTTSSGNSSIGKFKRLINGSTGECLVAFEATSARSI